MILPALAAVILGKRERSFRYNEMSAAVFAKW
nr:MAG TPA: hypothetical protein [Caudoviricetes sp.]